jgi:hypothetical protein
MTLPTEGDPKLWLAILHELEEAGGAARPASVYPKIRGYFSGITDADTTQTFQISGTNIWTHRIDWARSRMVEHGLMDDSEHGVWQVTPTGRRWLRAEWRGPQVRHASVVRPRIVAEPSREEPGQPDRTGKAVLAGVPRPARIEPSASEAKTMQRLVTRALAEIHRTDISGLDQYLIAIVSYELGRFTDALRLLDAALAAGLDAEYRAKTERLREICLLKVEG